MRSLTAMWFAAGTVLACAKPPAPSAEPPSLGLSGAATYQEYLGRQASQFKMHHQVEARFGEREEVIEGFLVVARPDTFWVHARSPFGPALFDVRGTGGQPLSVRVHVKTAEGDKLARYLARDIQRLYLIDCPAHALVSPDEDGYVVECPLPSMAQEAIPGDDGVDDRLLMDLNRGGVVLKKRFFRGPQLSATVDYGDFRPADGRLCAHEIALTHHTLPYSLRVALIKADFAFHADRVLRPEAGPAP